MPEALRKFVTFFSYGMTKRDLAFSCVVIVACVILWFLPTGFEDRLPPWSSRTKGRVVEVDNSMLTSHGLVNVGGQNVTVELLDGPFKGEVVEAHNNLLSKIEMDKVFKPGDYALMNLSAEGGKIRWANAYDYYRLDALKLLLGLFVVFLVLYGGFTGCQAVLSFAFTGLCMWKLLIPMLLKYHDPIVVTFCIVVTLTAVIIFLVAGLNRKGLTAFLGAVIGLAVTCVIALVFAGPMHVNGAVRPFSETLLFAGFGSIDLTRIFLAGIFLSSSGAVMDLAIDISSAMNEVVTHHPKVSRFGLLKSGIMVGRAVIGSMTTTLILAYSGSCLTMLMLFMGQGVPNTNILNLTYVSAEILHTLAGSFGLVLVAPLTAIIGSLIYVRPSGEAGAEEAAPVVEPAQ